MKVETESRGVVLPQISPNFVEMKLYAHSDLLTVARAKHGPGFEPSVPAPM